MTDGVATARWRRAWRACRVWSSRELRPQLSIVSALVVYGVLRVVFAHVVGSGGFATPGSLDTRLAVFALVVLVMRITVLVGVPLIATYRIVRRLFALGPGRDGGAHTGERTEASPAVPSAVASSQPPSEQLVR